MLLSLSDSNPQELEFGQWPVTRDGSAPVSGLRSCVGNCGLAHLQHALSPDQTDGRLVRYVRGLNIFLNQKCKLETPRIRSVASGVEIGNDTKRHEHKPRWHFPSSAKYRFAALEAKRFTFNALSLVTESIAPPGGPLGGRGKREPPAR